MATKFSSLALPCRRGGKRAGAGRPKGAINMKPKANKKANGMQRGDITSFYKKAPCLSPFGAKQQAHPTEAAIERAVLRVVLAVQEINDAKQQERDQAATKHHPIP